MGVETRSSGKRRGRRSGVVVSTRSQSRKKTKSRPQTQPLLNTALISSKEEEKKKKSTRSRRKRNTEGSRKRNSKGEGDSTIIYNSAASESSLYYSEFRPITECSHVKSTKYPILTPKTTDALLNPRNWLCSNCGTTDGVWACLHCPSFLCGRDRNRHALTHFEQSKHPLVIDVNTQYLFCYGCDAWIEQDNDFEPISQLREQISSVLDNHPLLLRTRSGIAIQRRNKKGEQTDADDEGEAVEKQLLDLDRRDQLETALSRWRHLLMWKAFNTWRDVVLNELDSEDEGEDYESDGNGKEESKEFLEVDIQSSIFPTKDLDNVDQQHDEEDQQVQQPQTPIKSITSTVSEQEATPTKETSDTMANARSLLVSSPVSMHSPFAQSPEHIFHPLQPQTMRTPSSTSSPPAISARQRRLRHALRRSLSSSAQKLRFHKPLVEPGMSGLRNLGQTCYMNAVLQAMAHIDLYRLPLYDLGKKGLLMQKTPSTQSPSKKSVYYTRRRRATDRHASLMRQTTSECFNYIQTPVDGEISYLRKRRKRRAPRPSPLESSSTQSSSADNNLNTTEDSTTAEETNTNEDHSVAPIPHLLESLFRVLWSGKWTVLSPYAVLGSVWKVAPSFRGYHQQDAQEFLLILEDAINDGLDEIEGRLEGVCEVPVAHSLLRSVTDGDMKSTITCSHCKFKSISLQKFSYLALDIQDLKRGESETLDNMLQNFFKPEVLEGNIYNCSNCSAIDDNGNSSGCGNDEGEDDDGDDGNEEGEVSSAAMTPVSFEPKEGPEGASNSDESSAMMNNGSTCLPNSTADGSDLSSDGGDKDNSQRVQLRSIVKDYTIASLPSVLKICVKRFRWGQASRFKVQTHVQLPPSLDMASLCEIDSSLTDIQPLHRSAVYDLAAVITHEGAQLMRGHYTCYCNLGGSNRDSSNWVLSNDVRMKHVSLEEVLSTQVYLAFYVHRGASEFVRDMLHEYPGTPISPLI
eukprot:m.43653 g.43653  ORF g.43653 m.43653 type:complete len:973 (-) comp10564_c0_seq2:133-3051(-)